MTLVSLGIRKLEGSLLYLDPIANVKYNERVLIKSPSGLKIPGRCVLVSEQSIIVEVYKGTKGLNLGKTEVEFTGSVYKMPLSEDMINRVFDGLGEPIDDGPDIIPEKWENINGRAINPFARQYPEALIETGIGTIDTLCTLVQGQKLPIFSSQGLPHDGLAARIVKHAKIHGNKEDDRFLVIFAGIGIKNDTAIYFKNNFERTASKVILFFNLASDPTIERLLTPRIALTAAEYFAFSKGYHVLVIMTDMTNYCEALREISASRDEIPSRKGYPGYMYSDLASLYERAGRISNIPGSITQIPILTMPNDDINNPVPDLTGYITEGQIVLSKNLYGRGISPPIEILSSLSRIMKDAIKGETREDHSDVMSQIYASYSKALDIRALQAIVGDEGLSPLDKKYLNYADSFEKEFLTQPMDQRRSFTDSLNLAWKILSILPRTELTRIKSTHVAKYYMLN